MSSPQPSSTPSATEHESSPYMATGPVSGTERGAAGPASFTESSYSPLGDSYAKDGLKSPVPPAWETEQMSEEVPEKYVVTTGVDTEQVRGIVGERKLPCLYTYLPWSECSASCWNGQGDLPQMYRKVNRSSIIQARAGDKPECPANLHMRVDYAPCNTYRCPTNLSSYAFSKECIYKNANLGAKGGCYRIRDVPLDDRLVYIDAHLTEDCNQRDCEHFIL